MTTLDQLAHADFGIAPFEVNGQAGTGILMTLRFTRFPSAVHHQLPPLLLSESQAQDLAMALLAMAERLRGAAGPAPSNPRPHDA